MLVHQRVKDPEWVRLKMEFEKRQHPPTYHITTEHDDKPLDSGDSLFSTQSQVVDVCC